MVLDGAGVVFDQAARALITRETAQGGKTGRGEQNRMTALPAMNRHDDVMTWQIRRHVAIKLRQDEGHVGKHDEDAQAGL